MEDPQQPDRPTPDPTLAQCILGGAGRRGVALPVALACQIVSEVAAELDALHVRGRTHGDVRAERIAVPLTGPAYLLVPEGPATPVGIGQGAEAVLHSLDVTMDGDVTGLVAAAYFALSGTPPHRLFPPTVSPGAARRARVPFPFLPGRPAPRPPSGVFGVLAKGLGLPRSSRYASAGGFAAALRAAASPPTPTRSSSRPPLTPLAACALLTPFGIGLLALGMWLGHRQTRVPTRLTPPEVSRSAAVPMASARVSSSDAALWREWLPVPVPPVRALPPPMGAPQRPMTAASASLVRSRTTPAEAPTVPTAHIPRRFRAALGRVEGDAMPPTHRADAARAGTSGGDCYLLVYARQFVSQEDLADGHPQAVRPQRVLVDGRPSASLTAGRWTPVTPGVHRIAFYPVQGGPFDPNANFRVRLGPGRQSLQIPLPRHPRDARSAAPRKPLSPEPGRGGLPETLQDTDRSAAAHGGMERQPEAAILSVSSAEPSGGRRTGL